MISNTVSRKRRRRSEKTKAPTRPRMTPPSSPKEQERSDIPSPPPPQQNVSFIDEYTVMMSNPENSNEQIDLVKTIDLRPEGGGPFHLVTRSEWARQLKRACRDSPARATSSRASLSARPPTRRVEDGSRRYHDSEPNEKSAAPHGKGFFVCE